MLMTMVLLTMTMLLSRVSPSQLRPFLPRPSWQQVNGHSVFTDFLFAIFYLCLFCILPFPGFFPFQFQIVSVLKLNIELNLFRCLSWQEVNSRSIFTDILFSISLGACFKLCHQNSYRRFIPVLWSISLCHVVSSKWPGGKERRIKREIEMSVFVCCWNFERVLSSQMVSLEREQEIPVIKFTVNKQPAEKW